MSVAVRSFLPPIVIDLTLDEDEKECVVCLDDRSSSSSTRVDWCGQGHYVCVNSCASTVGSWACPVCRRTQTMAFVAELERGGEEEEEGVPSEEHSEEYSLEEEEKEEEEEEKWEEWKEEEERQCLVCQESSSTSRDWCGYGHYVCMGTCAKKMKTSACPVCRRTQTVAFYQELGKRKRAAREAREDIRWTPFHMPEPESKRLARDLRAVARQSLPDVGVVDEKGLRAFYDEPNPRTYWSKGPDV
jgi:glutaredoxin